MQSELAQLHEDVVFGRSRGRIIWQPRIICWYDDKKFAGEALPAAYEGMEIADIYRSLGCSARLYEFNACFRRVEDERVNHVWRETAAGEHEHIIETPVGQQRELIRHSPNNPHPIHVKWPISSEQELKVLIWREEHASWQWDQARYDGLVASLGDLGAPTMFMPRMNVQSLYIEHMGTQNGIYALYDWPHVAEEFFVALEENHERLIDVINASPVNIINFGENIHAATLPPRLFEKYHLPACQRRCEKLHAAGKFVCAHWDGNCGPLLPYAQQTGLDGIEAITPKPQGDVEIEQIKEALGDEMFLLDGIPAVYFDDVFPLEVLEHCVHQLIALFAPRLVLGISDEISSTGDIERVRFVGDIVANYNAQFA